MKRSVFILVLVFFLVHDSVTGQQQYKVGVEKADITPTEPVILGGYASRNAPHEGVDTKLWARALAIGGKSGAHLVIAVDSCGVPLEFTERVFSRINETVKLDRDAFVICASHSHTSPSLPGYAPIIWQERVGKSEFEAAARYSQFLEDSLVSLALTVLKFPHKATLSWGQGRVKFGGNRRLLNAEKWRGFGFQYDGPVDHSLPVLIVKEKTKIVAIWTNYACHCTTMGARNMVNGDWVGYANAAIEKAFPDAVSLTTIGCGADVGPQPSGNIESAQRNGSEIGIEVARLVRSLDSAAAKPHDRLEMLESDLTANSKTVPLPFKTVHSPEYWEQQATRPSFDGVLARSMLSQIKKNGKLDKELPYRITTWQFGDELGIVFLPGEVCVDYAVRLKTENDWKRLWINGWCNDVPCYIPSRRILLEGGYEADSSMIYYNRPSRFDDSVEEKIVTTTNELLNGRFANDTDADPARIFSQPPLEEVTASRFRETIRSYNAEQKTLLEKFHQNADSVQAGFSELEHCEFDDEPWFDFLGRTADRPFVRQLKVGDRVSWKTSALKIRSDEPVTICFSGGIGWQSQPETAGFKINVGSVGSLNFDVTREIAAWKSESGDLEMLYLPTWKSNEDSAGFFVLMLRDSSKLTDGKPVSIQVESLGSQSQRWFAVDRRKNATESLVSLLKSADR